MPSAWTPRVLVMFGLVLAAGSLLWMKSQVASAERLARYPVSAPVLVPRVTIQEGSVLNPVEFRTLLLPLSDVPPGALTVASQVSGPIARQTLWPGEPVVSGMLYASPAAAALQNALPAGMRAMDVSVGPAAGIGGILGPGDRVDVLAVLTQSPARVTVLVADIPVLAVLGGNAGSASATGAAAPGSYTSVLLEVTPRQADALALAQTQGPITLVLRNPGRSTIDTPTVAQTALTGGMR